MKLNVILKLVFRFSISSSRTLNVVFFLFKTVVSEPSSVMGVVEVEKVCSLYLMILTRDLFCHY